MEASHETLWGDPGENEERIEEPEWGEYVRVKGFSSANEKAAYMGRMKVVAQVFSTLRGHGVAVPGFEIGEEDGSFDVAIISERVEGVHVDEIKYFSRDTGEAFKTFFHGMIEALRDASQKGSAYVGDVGNHQVLYGRRKGEDRDRAYFVDIESESVVIPSGKNTVQDIMRMEGVLRALIEDMRSLSLRLPPDANLQSEIQGAETFLEFLQDTEGEVH